MVALLRNVSGWRLLVVLGFGALEILACQNVSKSRLLLGRHGRIVTHAIWGGAWVQKVATKIY